MRAQLRSSRARIRSTRWLMRATDSKENRYRRFGILVDRNDDRLHMRVAPAFARRSYANLSQGFYPWRVIRVMVVPFERC